MSVCVRACVMYRRRCGGYARASKEASECTHAMHMACMWRSKESQTHESAPKRVHDPQLQRDTVSSAHGACSRVKDEANHHLQARGSAPQGRHTASASASARHTHYSRQGPKGVQGDPEPATWGTAKHTHTTLIDARRSNWLVHKLLSMARTATAPAQATRASDTDRPALQFLITRGRLHEAT